MNINFNNLEEEIKQRGKIETLDNGIVLISEDLPNLGLAKGDIKLCTGFAYEKPEDHGVMHFLEHVCFGESRLYPDRDERNLNSAIINLMMNAGTGLFSTMFPVRGANQTRYLMGDNFPEALRTTYDSIFFPQIIEETVERERLIIQRELVEKEQRNATNPYHEINKTVGELCSKNNPIFRGEGLGTQKSIDAITVERLKDYHSEHFVGSNAIIDIIGDLNGSDGQDLNRVIKDILQDVPKGVAITPYEIKAEDPFEEHELFVAESPVQSDLCVEIYFQVPPSNSLESGVVSLLNSILGAGPENLLFKDVRESKGLVYSINSMIGGHIKTGILRVKYLVSPLKFNESIAAVGDNFDKLKRGEFDDRLIDAYKNSYLPAVLAQLRHGCLVRNELRSRYDKERFGYESTGFERLKVNLELTKQDVVDAANKYLGDNSLTVIVK